MSRTNISKFRACIDTNQCYAITEALSFCDKGKIPLYYKNLHTFLERQLIQCEIGEAVIVENVIEAVLEEDVCNPRYYPPNEPMYNMVVVEDKLKNTTPLDQDVFEDYEKRPGDGVVGPFSSQIQLTKALGFDTFDEFIALSKINDTTDLKSRLIIIGQHVCKSDSFVSNYWALVIAYLLSPEDDKLDDDLQKIVDPPSVRIGAKRPQNLAYEDHPKTFLCTKIFNRLESDEVRRSKISDIKSPDIKDEILLSKLFDDSLRFQESVDDRNICILAKTNGLQQLFIINTLFKIYEAKRRHPFVNEINFDRENIYSPMVFMTKSPQEDMFSFGFSCPRYTYKSINAFPEYLLYNIDILKSNIRFKDDKDKYFSKLVDHMFSKFHYKFTINHFEFIIKELEDINITFNDHTLLQYACTFKHIDLIKLLLDRDADIMSESSTNNGSVLHLLTAPTKVLGEHEVNDNQSERSPVSALSSSLSRSISPDSMSLPHSSASLNNDDQNEDDDDQNEDDDDQNEDDDEGVSQEVFEEDLETVTNYYVVQDGKYTDDQIDTLKRLVFKCRTIINCTHDFNTALTNCIGNSNYILARILLENGAYPTLGSFIALQGETLHTNYQKYIDLLLEFKANINYKPQFGQTTFLDHVIINAGSMELISYILEKGANANMSCLLGTDTHTLIPIWNHESYGENAPNLIKLLIDKGANPNQNNILLRVLGVLPPTRRERKYIPIIYQILYTLLENGAIPNSQTLKQASYEISGDEKLINLFLEKSDMICNEMPFFQYIVREKITEPYIDNLWITCALNLTNPSILQFRDRQGNNAVDILMHHYKSYIHNDNYIQQYIPLIKQLIIKGIPLGEYDTYTGQVTRHRNHRFKKFYDELKN